MKKMIVFSLFLILFSCSSGSGKATIRMNTAPAPAPAVPTPPIAPITTAPTAPTPPTPPAPPTPPTATPTPAPSVDPARVLYRELAFEGRVSFEAFRSAFEGYESVAGRRHKEVLTLIDFTRPSDEPRLWVIDMSARRVLFNTWVAHGSGSGERFATRFSNRNGSHQSSLGLYLTAEAYTGRRGYSMMLDGQQPGINDNARSRGVIVHGAAYASPDVIAAQGRLGRSWGCPALPPEVTRPVIDAIKNGSVLYIYGIRKSPRQ